MEEERKRSGNWLGFVLLCVPFSIFTMMIGWQEGYYNKDIIRKDINPIPLISKPSLP